MNKYYHPHHQTKGTITLHLAPNDPGKRKNKNKNKNKDF